jgi:ectoine hydroxylase-related dioxygenase (phytanoyl-CoA dioxygenase family)
MVLGVALSDVTMPYAGNLTVWPGTHHLYEQYFRENGPQALLNGMPPVALPEPVQVLAKAGDIIMAHYELAHGVAQNVSPHPRFAIYFRLYHIDHDHYSQDAMTNIWREWEGMKGIVS